MLRRGYIIALLLTAWTMGLEFAHVLEWPVKAGYPGQLYVRLQESLYLWFGNVGSVVYVLAILVTVTLAVLLRHNTSVRRPLAVAAGLQVLALATFFAVIYPVNLGLPVNGSGEVPAGWAAMRDRWEAGHAVGFVLFTAAFLLLLVAALRARDDVQQVPPRSSPSPAEVGDLGDS